MQTHTIHKLITLLKKELAECKFHLHGTPEAVKSPYFSRKLDFIANFRQLFFFREAQATLRKTFHLLTSDKTFLLTLSFCTTHFRDVLNGLADGSNAVTHHFLCICKILFSLHRLYSLNFGSVLCNFHQDARKCQVPMGNPTLGWVGGIKTEYSFTVASCRPCHSCPFPFNQCFRPPFFFVCVCERSRLGQK